MTQYPSDPNQPAPVPYAGGDVAQAARPGAVTTPAVLAIILGSLGTLCCGLSGVVGGLVNLAQGNQLQLPNGTTYQQDAGPALANVAFAGADLVTSSILLAAGIGALSRRPWARRAGVAVSAVILAVGVVRVVLAFVLHLPQMERTRAHLQQTGVAQQPGGAIIMAMMNPMAFTIITIVVFLLIAAVVGSILKLWTTPAVKAWFDGDGAGAGGYGGYPQG